MGDNHPLINLSWCNFLILWTQIRSIPKDADLEQSPVSGMKNMMMTYINNGI